MTDATGAQGMRPDSSGEQIPAELEIPLRADYQREDERWSTASQVRDALIIVVVGLVVFAWELFVFLTERGIR